MTKLLAVLVLVSGCSVALQSKPRAGKVASGDCSTSSMYWIADAVGVGVGASVATAGAALSFSDSSEGRKDIGRAMVGVGLLTTLAYYASMDNGRKWSAECESFAAVAVR